VQGVSVYIPVLETSRALKYCLDGLLNQTKKPDEIILLYNGNLPEVKAIAARYNYNIRLVHLTGTFNRSQIKNVALQSAKYDLVASLHANSVPQKDWLKILSDRMRKHSEVIGAGGPLVETHTDSITNRYRCLHLHQNQGASVIINPKLLHGGNTIYRRQALLGIGGYNQDLHNGEEDIELSSRIRKKGGLLIYDPSAAAYRYRRDSVSTIITLQWQSLRQMQSLIQSPLSPKDVWHNGKQMMKAMWKNQILKDLREKRFLFGAFGMATMTAAPFLEWKWYRNSTKYLIPHTLCKSEA
jgi:cellulose synthase/poly-beta-1,6-N-acetylglucosamine synthase-like glycosyltransferase